MKRPHERPADGPAGRPSGRPVAITGLGIVTAAGMGMDCLWDALTKTATDGSSCIGPLTAFDASGFPSRLAAQVPELSARDWVPKHYRKATKVMARDTVLAVAGASLAVGDANMVTRAHESSADANADKGFQTTYPANRVGCHIGAGLIAAETNEISHALASAASDTDPTQLDMKKWGGVSDIGVSSGGMNNLPPLWLLKYLPNMLACHVTIVHGCEGPSNTITCGEASSLLSLGESSRVIERAKADACIAGGGESKLNPMGMMRMHFAGQLADVTEDDAQRATDIVQPFSDVSRGSIAGESCGLLVLEAIDAASGRDAHVYAVLSGFGSAMDSADDVVDGLTEDMNESFWPTGTHEGVVGAINAALGDADISADDIDLIVPQGIGVPDRDRAEWNALEAVFGDRLTSIARVDCVPTIGLSWASQGAIQTAVAAACIDKGCVPGGSPGGGSTVGPTEGQGEGHCPKHALVCSYGIGGLAAAVVLSRADGLP